MEHGNTKKAWDFFIKNKQVLLVLGNKVELAEPHKQEITEFFEIYNDRDRAGTWRKNIATWIVHSLSNWVWRRAQLGMVTSNSVKWHQLMYGTTWDAKYAMQTTRLIKYFPTTEQYWLSKGHTKASARIEISKIQRARGEKAGNKLRGTSEYTVRSTKYWVKNGYSEVEAAATVASIQRRDKDFFVSAYGVTDGTTRFNASKLTRKNTWKTKDKAAHAKKTLPGTFNPHGQEMQAINGFLETNNIPRVNCRYGSPKDQYWQQIPEVGYRRYDLAVFSSKDRKDLKYIVEFHGPGHINFSDYKKELDNERITIGGRQLAHLGTYGASYRNDMAKRDWILKNNPGVQYFVIWLSDLINKRFSIDELL